MGPLWRPIFGLLSAKSGRLPIPGSALHPGPCTILFWWPALLPRKKNFCRRAWHPPQWALPGFVHLLEESGMALQERRDGGTPLLRVLGAIFRRRSLEASDPRGQSLRRHRALSRPRRLPRQVAIAARRNSSIKIALMKQLLS